MLFKKLLGTRSVADVAFVSASSTTSGGRNVTVTAPTGIQNGDLLVAVGFQNDNASTLTLPSGFTSRLSDTGSRPSVILATKVASSESGNYAFVWGGGANNALAILVYRNAVDTGRLIGAVTRSSTTSTGAEITPTTAGALLGFFHNETSGRTVSTAPSGMTQRVLTTADCSLAVYDIAPNATGATGAKSLVWSGGGTTAGVLMQIHKG